jgi:methionyl-tRNA formyltransferase
MGTPDFAVESLHKILQAGFEVSAVVTAPDKPAGRGRQLQESAVKKFALQNNLQILQPVNLKAPEFIEELRALKADIQVVVAFRMLPEVVWNMPRLGTFNLHASLLPKYRGAAPINWAVINGETESGVTVFKLRNEIDSGTILHAEKIEIGKEESVGDVHDKMMQIGAGLLVKSLKEIQEADKKKTELKFVEQIVTEVTHAPKLNRENCRIDWKESGMHIYNKIRGLSPYPGAWCILNNGGENELKLFKTNFIEQVHTNKIGSLVVEKNTLSVFVKDGLLQIEELQLQGKKRMSAADFLKGYRFGENSFLH